MSGRNLITFGGLCLIFAGLSGMLLWMLSDPGWQAAPFEDLEVLEGEARFHDKPCPAGNSSCTAFNIRIGDVPWALTYSSTMPELQDWLERFEAGYRGPARAWVDSASCSDDGLCAMVQFELEGRTIYSEAEWRVRAEENLAQADSLRSIALPAAIGLSVIAVILLGLGLVRIRRAA